MYAIHFSAGAKPTPCLSPDGVITAVRLNDYTPLKLRGGTAESSTGTPRPSPAPPSLSSPLPPAHCSFIFLSLLYHCLFLCNASISGFSVFFLFFFLGPLQFYHFHYFPTPSLYEVIKEVGRLIWVHTGMHGHTYESERPGKPTSNFVVNCKRGAADGGGVPSQVSMCVSPSGKEGTHERSNL